MNSETLKLNRRTYSEGEYPLDLMGKIADIEPNAVFCLTQAAFWGIFMSPGDKDCHQGNNEEGETLIGIHWSSEGYMTLMVNDTHDLFTLTSSTTRALRYEYPEKPSNIYIIDRK